MLEATIYLFGDKSCKFCKVQSEILNENFPNNWVYADVTEDAALELAMDLKIEHIPTTVVECGGKIILKKEGVVESKEIVEKIKDLKMES